MNFIMSEFQHIQVPMSEFQDDFKCQNSYTPNLQCLNSHINFNMSEMPQLQHDFLCAKILISSDIGIII